MSHHDTAVPRVLLLLPTATYRAPDFVAAARALGVEVVVGSERAARRCGRDGRPGGRGAARRTPRPRSTRSSALDGRRRVDAVVAVDDQGVLVAATAASPARPPAQPARRGGGDARQGRDAAAPRGGEVPQPALRGHRRRAHGDVGFPCVVKPVGAVGEPGRDPGRRPGGRRRRGRPDRARSWTGRCSSRSTCPASRSRSRGCCATGELEVLAVFDKPDPLVGPVLRGDDLRHAVAARAATLLAAIERVTADARRRDRAHRGPGPRRAARRRRIAVVGASRSRRARSAGCARGRCASARASASRR